MGLRLAELRRDPVRAARDVLKRRQFVAKSPHKSVTTLPARVYVAVGLSDIDAQALIRTLRQRILVDADHLPVVVTDQPTLRGMRLPGVILEYLPDPHTWECHDPGEHWESLLTGRIAHLCRDYGVVATIVVDPRDPPTLARLLAPVTPV